MLTRWPRFARAVPLAAAALGAVMVAAPASAQNRSEPIARFSDPVCPAVSGLRVDAAAVVVGRMRANAEAAGIAVAPMGTCAPNILIAVVDDSPSYLRRLQRERPLFFQELDWDQRQALKRTGQPVQIMLRTRDYTRDGAPVGRAENLVDVPQTRMWMAHSKIYTATRRDIHSALLLFDGNALEGMTFGQLADYASLRAFSQVQPAAEGAATISSLFEAGSSAPEELTAADRAFLRTLYEGMANLPGISRLAQLRSAVESAVE